MQQSQWLVASVLTLALPLVACSKEETQAAGQSASKAVDAAKEMGAKAADEIARQFGELKSKAEGQTAGVDAAIADLKRKAEAKGAEAKTSIDALVADLAKKKDEIVKMVSSLDVKALDAKALEDAKKKLEPLLAELQKLIDKAKSM
ncbi:MAG: hypothetical protein JNK02_16885 [Planctomycetes bacterium]|nr:hypothetical protein [Planctomycetota bacterium]